MAKKINLLSKENVILSSRDTAAIFGGKTCSCACYYRNVGGSSIADNREANYAGGLHSPQITSDMEIKADLSEGGTDIW